MARPPKYDINLDTIEKLAMIHCTNTEIASVIGCDVSLLSKPNYSQIVTKGKEKGKMTLRRKMYETAMGGNVTMCIWLSKQLLGFSEKTVVTNNSVEEMSAEVRLQYLEEGIKLTKLEIANGSKNSK